MKDLYDSLTITMVLYEESFSLISKCLDKIKNFKIIIIDNAGDVELKKKIQDEYLIFKYLLNDKNLGFSKAINQGIKLCNTEFILNLEADCLIDEDNIYKLYKAINLYPDCVITTPTMINDKNELTPSGGALMEKNLGYEALKLEGDVCVDFPMPAAILFRKKEMVDLGLFDEDLFIFFPDCEIGRRIQKNRKSTIQIFNSIAVHTMGTLKIKNKFKNIFFRNYYFTLDGLIYYFKENLHTPHLKKLKKKIPNYIFKSILNILIMNLGKSVQFISMILAYYNFKKKYLNKSKIT